MSGVANCVIVGASLAGASAAAELREQGFEGRILLIGEEAERPYERPPLSKDHLRGEASRDKVFVHPEGFYDDHGIELLLGSRVTDIDRAASRVIVGDKERAIPFDRLLIATGASPRRLHLPGGELEGIHYLRRLADSDRLAWALRGAGRLVVVGGGWIGAEVAASARQLGVEVVLVEQTSTPLERVLGHQVGSVWADLHRGHGVHLLTNSSVAGFEGSGRVERVRLAGGRTLECDLVAVGVGVVPNAELAALAGLQVDDGVVVDSELRTEDPRIFAAGDVATAWHPLYDASLRVEHWANAKNQGVAAARSMLGVGEPYERVPYFFSDQYDAGMEYSGHAPHWDRVVLRGDPSDGEFIAFWLEGDRVLAGMNVNIWDVVEPIQELVRSRAPVGSERLADVTVPLTDLAAEAAEGAR